MISKTDKIVFVYPYQQQPFANKASHIRPLMMEMAFIKQFGKNLLISNGKERFKKIPKNDKIMSLYLESINRPFFIQRMIEKDWRIFSDYWNLWRLKKQGTKLAVFYRDGFWAGKFLFEEYSLPIAMILKLCYQLEWFIFKKLFDTIYLPSLELAEFMGEKNIHWFKVLLPGCYLQKQAKLNCTFDKNKSSELTFLYSGGIIPPLNDITLMLKLLDGRKNIRLILIVRHDEWQKYRHYYQWKHDNIELVTDKQGYDLQVYYACADACLMLYPFHTYRYLAMPYKAFEAMGYGLPLISFSDCVMGDFIKHNKLGLSKSYDEFDELMTKTNELSLMLHKYKKNVINYAQNNTWEHRVEQVKHEFSN